MSMIEVSFGLNIILFIVAAILIIDLIRIRRKTESEKEEISKIINEFDTLPPSFFTKNRTSRKARKKIIDELMANSPPPRGDKEGE